MFYKKQDERFCKNYIKSLQLIGNLSNLFSDSTAPYLHYRVAEKVFCYAFGAHDLSRSDISFDAAKNGVGIGLKTFLKKNDKTTQKIAEFNKDRFLYELKSHEEIVHIVSDLRNQRIEFAKNTSGTKSSLYHCVLRSQNKFFIFEEEMATVEIEHIKNIKAVRNILKFDDGKYEYSFNLSKSTLYKRFYTENILDEFDVEIFENPLEKLRECFCEYDELEKKSPKIIASVHLPLYGSGKIVPQKSGLNQWNASGRARDYDEIYIPIPVKVRKLSENFFPSRDKIFTLKLPNQEILNTKVCQDNDKALMSNPNKALGKWLLRDVLNLREGEILTYEKLQTIGIDAVRIDKYDGENYAINFASLGSYEEFIDENS